MPLAIAPLDAAQLPAAAAVLALRQAWLRRSMPELPARYEDPAAAAELLTPLVEADEAHGVIAFDGDTPLAYLVGTARHEPIWNRATWSPVEGQAADPGIDPDVMRDVYAAWAPHWVERGFFAHYVLVPAAAEGVIGAWFDLNFGKMQAHAARTTDVADLSDPHSGPELELRRIGAGDGGLIRPLHDLIARHQVESPAFAITLPERYAKFAADFAEDLADPGSRYWVAFDDDRPIGLAGFYDAAPGPTTPDGAWELGVAMTAPEARGRGVQRALLREGLSAAREAGAGHCITDWRTANLLSSRSWTALGFRPVHYRLHRAIDPRVAWARPPSAAGASV